MPPSQGSESGAGHSCPSVKSLTLLQGDGTWWQKCAPGLCTLKGD
jgi:hypothetical protein